MKAVSIICHHCSDVIMSAMASQINSLTIVYSTLYSWADEKKSKLRVTGICEGNSPVTGEFPAQRASNAKNVSIWWCHHVRQVDWHIDHLGSMRGHTQSVYWFLINDILSYSFVSNFTASAWATTNHVEFENHRNRSIPPPYYRIYPSMDRVSIGSGNDLPPVRRQAITWANPDLVTTGPLGTQTVKFESKYKIHFHSWKWMSKCRLRNDGHCV